MTGCRCWITKLFLAILMFICHNSLQVAGQLPTALSCPSRCHDASINSMTAGSRIFYLILVHDLRTIRDAVHLVRTIRDPRNIILVHWDARQPLENLEQSDLARELHQCPCGATVRLESKFQVEWSHWSMNLPTLWALELAVTEYSGQWDTFINLSGDTLAVYTADRMAQLLVDLQPYNFVTSRACETGLIPTNVYSFPKVWHKRRHYTVDETIADPVFFDTVEETSELLNLTIQTHFGSQWVILRYEFVEWLVRRLQDNTSWVSQYREWLRDSGRLMTDETFLPTVLVYSPFLLPRVGDTTGLLLFANGTESAIRHVRMERMDEHFPSSRGVFPTYQRYQIPESRLGSIAQPRVWGPYFLGVYDYGMLRDSGALFARKVSSEVDDNWHRHFPVENTNDIPDIRWPFYEVSVTPKPDWSREQNMWEQAMNQRSTESADDEEL